MKFLYLLYIVVIFSACQIKVNEIPAPNNLLPKDSLAVVLEELMLIEQNIQSKYPSLNQFQEIAKKSGDTLLNKYDISFRRFDEAMNYYGSRQDEMKQIYDQILENMNRKLNKGGF
ncbi:MAG: DUF4296 domain-containing protein [Flavobacteriia bacterium]|jgi:CHASE2 domain-containing sensor protein